MKKGLIIKMLHDGQKVYAAVVKADNKTHATVRFPFFNANSTVTAIE